MRDTDNDGIPNVWEIYYGLDENTNDADEDPDGDGSSNLEEYKANTNPNGDSTACTERGFSAEGVSTMTDTAGYSWSANCVNDQLTDYEGSTVETPNFALKRLKHDESSPEIFDYEYSYIDGVATGHSVEYALDWSTDAITYAWPYVNGIRNGTAKGESQVYPGIYEEAPWVDGVLHGTVTGYRSDGSMRYIHPYENGLKHGLHVAYDLNGNISVEEPYNNGIYDGTVKYYNYTRDGTIYYLSSETPYVEGLRNGVRKLYNQDGSFAKQTTYVDDLRVGPEKTYMECDWFSSSCGESAGSLVLEINWVDDNVRDGPTIEYAFNKDTLKSFPVAITPYVQDVIHGIAKTYVGYPADSGQVAGALKYETPYVNGQVDGLDIRYFGDSDNTVYEETPYVKNITQGIFNRYYISGVLEFTVPYVDDVREGLSKSYFETGVLHQEQEYSQGVPHGLTRQYYVDGSLFHEIHFDFGVVHGSWKEYYMTFG